MNLFYPSMVLLMAPLSIALGRAWGWTAGAASLVTFVIPVCLAALSGNRRTAYFTASIAGFACLGELLMTSSGIPNDLGSLIFSLLGIGALLGIGGMVVLHAEEYQLQLEHLTRQSTDYLRYLYERDRKAAQSATKAPLSEMLSENGEASPAPTDEPVNYPMLLLTLQDVGRRITTNLDLDSLVPIIVSTAVNLLKCGHCQLFLWNEASGTLRNPLPIRNRRDSTYVPKPRRGMAGWVISERHILTRQDVISDYSLRSLLDEEADMPDAAAPLTVGGELLGIIVLHDVSDMSASFSRLFYILANISALAIKNAQLFGRIEEMAKRDGLTGLLNHATFQDILNCQAVAFEEDGQPLAIVMSDVDHFKKFNDTHGHQAGDHVLREVARLWQAVMPDFAVIARYGGEEFICAFPGQSSSRASELAEILRQTLEDFTMDFEGNQLKVTASFGVSEFSSGAKPETIIRLADEALYRAKQLGRNRVSCAVVPRPQADAETAVL